MANVGSFTQTVGARNLTPYVDQFALYATQYFINSGGRYVTLDTGSGYYKLSVAGDVQLDGWVDICYVSSNTANPSNTTPYISSATNGVSTVAGTKDIYNTNNSYWMPVKTGTTAATTNLDQEYDILIQGSTTTTTQVVDLSAQAQKVVKVIAIDTVNNLVQVCAVQQD